MGNISKGFAFEKYVTRMLNNFGIEAFRTNKANDDDPSQYKAGFDGGVDIIARYRDKQKISKEYVFYIQCKCHKESLTKSAIAEVYAGMQVRKPYGNTSFPVVIATSDASQETRQYAKELGVELILKDEINLIIFAKSNHKIDYGNYGNLVKHILYRLTNDEIWIDTLPDFKTNIEDISYTEKLLEESALDFDKAQSHLNTAIMFERRVNEERQKALDIQKVAVFRSIHANSNKHKEHKESETPAINDDGG